MIKEGGYTIFKYKTDIYFINTIIKHIMLCYKRPLSNKRPAMKLYTFVLLHKQTTYCTVQS